ncbi:MAG: family 16 glycoside hydrolase, partial [Planctomycetota bacterium]
IQLRMDGGSKAMGGLSPAILAALLLTAALWTGGCVRADVDVDLRSLLGGAEPSEPEEPIESGDPNEPDAPPTGIPDQPLQLFSPGQRDAWTSLDGSTPELAGGQYSGRSWLVHNRPMGDFDLDLQFRWRRGGEGTLVFRGAPEPTSPALNGYALRIGDRPGGPGGRLWFPLRPIPNPKPVSVRSGGWHDLKVRSRGERFEVHLDGRRVMQFEDDGFRYGHLAVRGSGVTFRKARLSQREDDLPRGDRSPWRRLFTGRSMDGWWAVRGEAHLQDGAMLVNEDTDGNAIVVKRGLRVKNGLVEAVVTRLAGAPVAPYTLSLRVAMQLNWSSIYCICYPERLKICRGGAGEQNPACDVAGRFERADRPEIWRFAMQGERIDAYRFGERVASYQDSDPTSGSVAITADGCRILVHDVRYRPLEPSSGTR